VKDRMMGLDLDPMKDRSLDRAWGQELGQWMGR